MNTLHIGLIGLGGMAEAHLRGLEGIPNVRVAALCDVSEAALDRIGERLGVPADQRFTDYKTLIEQPGVDAVISVTPNHLHAEIIHHCLKHRKPFLSEKPFTRTFKEADQLLGPYNEQPLPAMIGFSYRYTPAFRFVRELLTQGKIGRVRTFSVQYLQGWGAAVYDTPFLWRFDKAVTGTGTVGDLGTHMIDLAHYLIGPFKELSAYLETLIPERMAPESGEQRQVEVDDFACFQARMESGAMGTFQTTRNAIGSGNQLEITIYGDQGTVHASTEKDDEVTLIQLDADTGELVEKKLKVPQRARRSQWQDFVAMLSGEVCDGLPDFMVGYESQKVLEAVIQSDRLKRTVQVQEPHTKELKDYEMDSGGVVSS